MATTILCDFPLDFPFWFTPERILESTRSSSTIRQQIEVREIEVPVE